MLLLGILSQFTACSNRVDLTFTSVIRDIQFVAWMRSCSFVSYLLFRVLRNHSWIQHHASEFGRCNERGVMHGYCSMKMMLKLQPMRISVRLFFECLGTCVTSRSVWASGSWREHYTISDWLVSGSSVVFENYSNLFLVLHTHTYIKNRYVSLVTMSTVGYGDFYPITVRSVSTLEVQHTRVKWSTPTLTGTRQIQCCHIRCCRRMSSCDTSPSQCFVIFPQTTPQEEFVINIVRRRKHLQELRTKSATLLQRAWILRKMRRKTKDSSEIQVQERRMYEACTLCTSSSSECSGWHDSSWDSHYMDEHDWWYCSFHTLQSSNSETEGRGGTNWRSTSFVHEGGGRGGGIRRCFDGFERCRRITPSPSLASNMSWKRSSSLYSFHVSSDRVELGAHRVEVGEVG